MNFAAIFSAIMQVIPIIQNISNDRKAGSGLDVFQTIQKNAPDVVNFLTNIGAMLFPNLSNPSQQAQAAATALDQETVKKIQAALNAKGASPQLDVDGAYGPKTKAAVLSYQQKNGLATDEWAGPITQQSLGI